MQLTELLWKATWRGSGYGFLAGGTIGTGLGALVGFALIAQIVTDPPENHAASPEYVGGVLGMFLLSGLVGAFVGGFSGSVGGLGMGLVGGQCFALLIERLVRMRWIAIPLGLIGGWVYFIMFFFMTGARTLHGLQYAAAYATVPAVIAAIASYNILLRMLRWYAIDSFAAASSSGGRLRFVWIAAGDILVAAALLWFFSSALVILLR